MSFSHGNKARMWIDGFPAACSLNEFSLSADIDTADVTTLCKIAKVYVAGQEDSSVKMAGFFDTNTVSPTTTFEYLLNARKRTIFPVAYHPQGGAALGDPVYLLNGTLASYSVSTAADDAAALEMEYQSSTGLLRGKVLVSDGTRTTTGNGTSIDNTTSSTNGGAALLSVSSVLGTTPTLAVKIQHSVDNSVWVDVSGAAFVTENAQNGQYIEFTGTLQRYVRASWTIAGTTPSFTFTVAFRRL